MHPVANDNGLASIPQEDLELFRRMMRVKNVLQRRDVDNLNNSYILPSPSIRLQPALNPSRDGDLFGMDNTSCDDEEDDEEEDGDDDDEDDEEESEEDDDEDEDDHNDGNSYSSEDAHTEDDSSGSDDTFYYYREDIQQPLNDPDNTASEQHESQQSHVPPATDVLVPDSTSAAVVGSYDMMQQDAADPLCCWEHGCNGRKFTTPSNLRRHRREKSRARPECRCPRCGAVFSRTTARNTHMERGSCNRIRRYSNGRVRLNRSTKDS